MKPRVLVLQGDDELRTQVCAYLENARMQVLGLPALDQQAEATEHDVVVCEADPLLEGRVESLARLRSVAHAGVIALAARVRREDRIHALTLGVDYYLAPPVDFEELELLVRNLCHRRSAAASGIDGHGAAWDPAAPGEPLRQAWRFDCTAWALTAPSGRTLRVSQAEHQILQCLIASAGQVVPRQQVLAALGSEYVEVYNRNLDMMISRLRRKVRDRCGMALPVHSARGIGYVFTGVGDIVGE